MSSHEERFYRRVDWTAFGTASTAALVVYIATLAPTVTLEDSGELAVAADYLGVPHPPGYPIWTLLAWIFQALTGFVSFRGHPNPAWGAALLSAVSGAAAVGVIAMLASRSGSDLLRAVSHRASETNDGASGTPGADALAWCAGVAAALLFAFSPVMWSQSVIVEVYALNALLLALILLLCYQWLWRPSPRLLMWTALLFGLGLTNYQVLLLVGLTLLAVVMVRDLALFRDLAIAGLVYVLFIGALKLASLPSLQGFPKHGLGSGPMSLPDWGVLAALCAAAAAAAHMTTGPRNVRRVGLLLFAISGVTVITLLFRIPGAGAELSPTAQTVDPHSWRVPGTIFAAGLLALLSISTCNPRTRATAWAVIPALLVVAVCTYKGVMHGLVHPTSPWFWFYVALDVMLLVLFYHTLPRGRTVAPAILMAQVGVSFYLLMPMVSEISNPPMNWGYPLTWEGFKHAITRSQYEAIAFDINNIFTAKYLDQMGVYVSDLRRQFTFVLIPLGLLPLTAWELKLGRRSLNMMHCAVMLALLGGCVAVVDRLAFAGQDPGITTGVYRSIVAGLLLLASVGVAVSVVHFVSRYVSVVRDAKSPDLSVRVTAGVILLGLLGLFGGYAYLVARKLFTAQPAVIPAHGIFLGALIVVPPLALIGTAALMMSGSRLRSRLDASSHNWFLSILIGFAVMSMLLVALANLKGDLQDTFIQRVKFISSHAFYALWIAYGIALLLDTLVRVFRIPPAPAWVAAGVALLLPLVPIHENQHNAGLLREMGGAEQNGHTFGWQFGYYALVGAPGIIEENPSEAEPLPNPEYPPAMEPDAVFYGGTDPGRFVPTYMIYSAHVRPDVFLITQNALSDHTYMSVMRDLYGEDLWIPSRQDTTRAFSEYIQAAARQKGGGRLSYSGERVSIRGAAEVMKVNAILAERIFERNRFRHTFYLEESFPLAWMDPYLVPHGLILKIHDTPLEALPGASVRDDLDFWDWYTRRLCRDRRFLRDIVARKSFSKLRTSIARVYASRKLEDSSDTAYREALMLYPANPEATMRYIQNILIPKQRLADTRRLLERFGEWDPNNAGLNGLLNDVTRAERARQQATTSSAPRTDNETSVQELIRLSRELQESGHTNAAQKVLREFLRSIAREPAVAFELGKQFHDAGNTRAMHEVFRIYLALTNRPVPADHLKQMIQLYRDDNQLEPIIDVLQRHLQQTPHDVDARINLAVLQIIFKRYDDAVRHLKEAIRIGGGSAREKMRKDPRLAPVFKDERFKPLLDSTAATP
ncbi:MAG: DUF2723 domain-containing protein [Verrucomicrobia bacterium]|nr:DUF2723 domain-containing protein [Verrucomicrobiota bacterium]MDA1085770.1 DUF2723 domain-containing protein [Verrucomicrobiota bacterium]